MVMSFKKCRNESACEKNMPLNSTFLGPLHNHNPHYKSTMNQDGPLLNNEKLKKKEAKCYSMF